MVELLLLSRLQFAITTAFHFIFVPLTLGLALLVAGMETMYYRNKDETWRKMADFWGRVFKINFAIGLVSGLTLTFQFGTNWGAYAEFMGDVFGPPLAVEALLAFFLGGFGVHDFYLGNKRNGIIKLLGTILGIVLMVVGIAAAATTTTATGFAALPVLAIIGYIIILGVSIWAFVDFIRILTGSYQPVDGSYTD